MVHVTYINISSIYHQSELECLAAEGWKIESKRTVTESNCYDNEETIKFEAIDGEFSNEVLNV